MLHSKQVVILFSYLFVFFISAGIGLRSVYSWAPIAGFVSGGLSIFLARYFKEKLEQREKKASKN